MYEISDTEEHGLWIQCTPGNDHEDGDIMIATDDSKEENEKFDSVRLVSEVFYLMSSSSAIVTSW